MIFFCWKKQHNEHDDGKMTRWWRWFPRGHNHGHNVNNVARCVFLAMIVFLVSLVKSYIIYIHSTLWIGYSSFSLFSWVFCLLSLSILYFFKNKKWRILKQPWENKKDEFNCRVVLRNCSEPQDIGTDDMEVEVLVEKDTCNK